MICLDLFSFPSTAVSEWIFRLAALQLEQPTATTIEQQSDGTVGEGSRPHWGNDCSETVSNISRLQPSGNCWGQQQAKEETVSSSTPTASLGGDSLEAVSQREGERQAGGVKEAKYL